MDHNLIYVQFRFDFQSFFVSNRAVLCFLNEPGENSRIQNIPGLHLNYVSGDVAPAKPRPAPMEPGLDELRKVSRDLLAIRLQVDKHFQECQSGQEWQMVGRVIDRLLFGFYIVFIAFSFITITCIWTWSNYAS